MREQFAKETLLKDQDNTTELSKLIAASFLNVGEEKARAIVKVIDATSKDANELCEVKSPNRDVTIPGGEALRISCRLGIGPVDKTIPVLLEPEPDEQLPSGIEVPDTLLTIKAGSSCRINVMIRNTTSHSIVVKKKTVLGTLHQVQTVTPLEVVKVQAEILHNPNTDLKNPEPEVNKNTGTIQKPRVYMRILIITSQRRTLAQGDAQKSTYLSFQRNSADWRKRCWRKKQSRFQ